MFIGSVTIPEMDKYISFNLLFCDTDGSRPNKDFTIFTSMPAVPCNQTSWFMENTNNIWDTLVADKSQYYCIDNQNTKIPNIEGVYGGQKFKYWSVTVDYCTNSTLNNFSCKSRDQIQTFLSTFYVQLITSDYFLNAQNYTNPLVPTFNTRLLRMSAKNTRRDTYTFQLFDYITDVGIMLNDNRVETGVTLSGYESDFLYDLSATQIFKSIFTSKPIKTNFNRSYTKIQKIVADIGGFIKFCTIILQFISSKYAIIASYNNLYSYFLTKPQSQPQQVVINNDLSKVKINTFTQNPKVDNGDLSKVVKSEILNTKFNTSNNKESSFGCNLLRVFIAYYICCKFAKTLHTKKIEKIQNYLKETYSIEKILVKLEHNNDDLSNKETKEKILNKMEID